MDVNRENFALQYLADHATGENIKIRTLDVSKKELSRDLARATSFDQSILFKKLHDDIFGTRHAAPFGILIGDYEFSNAPADIDLLENLSQIAAAIHAPFLAAAAPQLLGLNDFAELAVQREFRPIFKTPEYTRWRTFRQSEAARYVCLTLPRALMRLDPAPVWGNSAFPLAARIISAFAQHGWFAKIRGRNGGAVSGLPQWTFANCRTSAEVVLELWQEKALAESGLISFGHHHGPSDGFAFVPTCHQPAVYENPESTETARLASDLRYVLSISRFVHYLRVIRRELPDSSPKQMLNTWIAQYVSGPEESSAAQPLGSAYVDISDATVSLRASPRFQLDAMIYGMRATFRLPSL
jgi:type VI secretion system protein ImpC